MNITKIADAGAESASKIILNHENKLCQSAFLFVTPGGMYEYGYKEHRSAREAFAQAVIDAFLDDIGQNIPTVDGCIETLPRKLFQDVGWWFSGGASGDGARERLIEAVRNLMLLSFAKQKQQAELDGSNLTFADKLSIKAAADKIAGLEAKMEKFKPRPISQKPTLADCDPAGYVLVLSANGMTLRSDTDVWAHHPDWIYWLPLNREVLGLPTPETPAQKSEREFEEWYSYSPSEVQSDLLKARSRAAWFAARK